MIALKFMSDKYTYAAEEAKQFFVRVSAEADALTVKIDAYADRAGKITKRENPVEFDAIVKESAHDLEAFAQRIDQLIPDYRHNLELLTKGFDERAKSLDPATDAGARELENIRRAAEALAGTASGVKPKVGALRGNLTSLRDANLDHRLTQSANRVIITSDTLLTAYEDLETFALKVSFSADPK
jgi:hypothetical protein